MLAILSIISATFDALLKALATEAWHMYAATGVSMLKMLAGPICRAMLSKIVPSNEIGKICARAEINTIDLMLRNYSL